MPPYQLIQAPGSGWIDLATGASIPNDPDNADCQDVLAWIEDGNTPLPADPLPIVYASAPAVEARLRTTDATAHEILRYPLAARHVYQASLTISGVDAASGATKVMEGRFMFKRPSTAAVMGGVTVVSDIRDAAAAAWAPSAAAQGTDVVFSVVGAAGRTIDWLLVGTVGTYAPDGLGA
jgi:hypothetical protein